MLNTFGLAHYLLEEYESAKSKLFDASTLLETISKSIPDENS